MDAVFPLKILDTMQEWTEHLAVNPDFTVLIPDRLTNTLFSLHRINLLLWNQEDKARRKDVPDSVIVAAKRTIDSLNQNRNDLIEQIDERLIEHEYAHLVHASLPVRTETPGSAFDRLSVLTLKIYHMKLQTLRTDVDADHIERCSSKLEILRQQRLNIASALRDVLNDLNNGVIRIVVYRQFKMYNDPTLNPELYTTAKKKNP